MTIAEILAEWGALYRPQGQSVKDLQAKLLYKQQTAAFFPLRVTDATLMEKAVTSFSSVVQAFQKAWTPKGAGTFVPTAIATQRLKIDVSEFPDDLEASWLGFLASSDLDRTKWPFVTWWLTSILDQKDDDMETNEVFWGTKVTPTPGEANSERENLLGLRKQINDGIDDETITPISMGAVPTDPVDFVEYVEEMYMLVDEKLRTRLDYFFMNTTLFQRYVDGRDRRDNMNYSKTPDTTKIKSSETRVQGLVSHAGSDKIWSTPIWNRQRGAKWLNNQTMFDLQKDGREIKALTDWREGYGYWYLPYLVTNDVDLS